MTNSELRVFPYRAQWQALKETPDFKAVFQTLMLFEYYGIAATDKDGSALTPVQVFERLFDVNFKKAQEEADSIRITYQVLPH